MGKNRERQRDNYRLSIGLSERKQQQGVSVKEERLDLMNAWNIVDRTPKEAVDNIIAERR